MGQKTTFTEHFSVALAEDSRVDKESGVVYGVKLNSNHSKNKRFYSDAVLERATSLYEGAKTFINHEDDGGGFFGSGPRKVQSVMGRLKNVKFSPGGHRAEWHVLPTWRGVLEDIKFDPSIFGFSHNVVAERTGADDEDGNEIVAMIHEVISVDLVAEPATTRGMFEATKRIKEEEAMAGEAHEKVQALLEAKVKEHEGSLLKLMSERDQAKAEAQANKTVAEDLKAKFAASESKLAEAEKAAREAKVEALIAEANLPEDVAKGFRESLKSLPLDAVKSVIESTKKLAATSPVAGRPQSDGRRTESAKREPTEEEIVGAFRG